MGLTVQCLTVDCRDKDAVATFWEQALGWKRTYTSDEIIYLEAPGAAPRSQPDLLFIDVPETKGVKNRLHLDLRPDDQAAEVARLEALGARRVDVGQGDQTWIVMADVEGNEFCVLRAR